MLLFNSGRKKQIEAQRMLVRVMNQQHQANVRMADARQVQRSNATVPVVVVPYVAGRPIVDEAFPATTKDLSAVGVGLVATQPIECDEVLIGFRSDDEIFFVRAKVKHQAQISPDFHQIGVNAVEVLHASDFPLLATLPL